MIRWNWRNSKAIPAILAVLACATLISGVWLICYFNDFSWLGTPARSDTAGASQLPPGEAVLPGQYPHFSHNQRPGNVTHYELRYSSQSTSDFRPLLGSASRGRPKDGAGAGVAESGLMGLRQDVSLELEARMEQTVVTEIQSGVGQVGVPNATGTPPTPGTPLSTGASERWVYFAFKQPLRVKVLVDGASAAAEQQALERALGLGVLAHYSQSGRLLGVRMPEDSPLVSATLRALLATFQVSFPVAPPNADSWNSEENDTGGTYQARYVIVPSKPEPARTYTIQYPGEPVGVRKEKTGYTKVALRAEGPGGQMPVSLVPSLRADLLWAPEWGVALQLDVMESNTARLGDSSPFAQWHTRASSRLLERSNLSAEALTQLVAQWKASQARGREVAPDALGENHEHMNRILRQTLGSMSLDQILAGLSAIDQGHRPSSDADALYLKLRAFVFLYPAETAKLTELLISLEPRSRAMQTVVAVLNAVGHVEAQGTLARAIQARAGDTAALQLLIPAIGTVKSPTRQTENILRELSRNTSDRDIATTAGLSLGIVAYELGGEEPARQARLVDEFLDTLGRAQTPEDKEYVLGILGNTGASKALSTIVPFLQDPAPSVRAQAALSLRKVAGADGVLLERLTQESDPFVRGEIAEALGQRDATRAALDVQRGLLSAEKDQALRMKLLKNIWLAWEKFPEAKQVVEQVRDGDRDPNLKRYAGDLLATSGR